jgi:hypothetical protein
MTQQRPKGLVGPDHAHQEGISPDMVHDIQTFIEELEHVWGNLDRKLWAERTIPTLHMKEIVSSAATYILEFQQLIIELQWDLDSAPVMSMFYF